MISWYILPMVAFLITMGAIVIVTNVHERMGKADYFNSGFIDGEEGRIKVLGISYLFAFLIGLISFICVGVIVFILYGLANEKIETVTIKEYYKAKVEIVAFSDKQDPLKGEIRTNIKSITESPKDNMYYYILCGESENGYKNKRYNSEKVSLMFDTEDEYYIRVRKRKVVDKYGKVAFGLLEKLNKDEVRYEKIATEVHLPKTMIH